MRHNSAENLGEIIGTKTQEPQFFKLQLIIVRDFNYIEISCATSIMKLKIYSNI